MATWGDQVSVGQAAPNGVQGRRHLPALDHAGLSAFVGEDEHSGIGSDDGGENADGFEGD